MPIEKQKPAAAPAPAKPFEVAFVIRGCCASIGGITPTDVFGGDCLSGKHQVDAVRCDPNFKIMAFADRASYAAWVAEHDTMVSMLRRAAADLGYELHQHGKLIETTRGYRLHRECARIADRKPER